MVTRGFSLVEVTVALVLLSVALLGVAAGGLLATGMLRRSAMTEHLALRSRALRDSLLANKVSGAAVVRIGPHEIVWTATEHGVEVVTELPDGARLHLRAAR